MSTARRIKIAAAIILPCIALALLCLKDYIFIISNRIPTCFFYFNTGYYCPTCGNTRSVKAFLSGNILIAARNNITIPFIGILLILLYTELITDVCGRRIRLLPRNGVFWSIVISAFVIYYVIRNFFDIIAPI